MKDDCRPNSDTPGTSKKGGQQEGAQRHMFITYGADFWQGVGIFCQGRLGIPCSNTLVQIDLIPGPWLVFPSETAPWKWVGGFSGV